MLRAEPSQKRNRGRRKRKRVKEQASGNTSEAVFFNEGPEKHERVCRRESRSIRCERKVAVGEKRERITEAQKGNAAERRGRWKEGGARSEERGARRNTGGEKDERITAWWGIEPVLPPWLESRSVYHVNRYSNEVGGLPTRQFRKAL